MKSKVGDSGAEDVSTTRTLGVRLARGTIRAVRAAAIAYLLVLLLMTFLERWLIYPVPNADHGDWQPQNFEYEDAWFASADGTRLHGWFVSHPNSKRVIVYCHGNGEDVSDNVDVLQILRDQLEASVLVFDYRGYGLSDGQPHEAGLVADGLAAQQWLSERAGVPTSDIVVMGRSIGGGVAVAMAAENGAKALVLQNTFARLVDTAAGHYPWLPVKLMMKDRYDSLARINSYDGPVFQCHGTADRVVPIEQGRQLSEALPTRNKVFMELPGGDHNDFPPADYYRKLASFLDALDPQ